MSTLTDIKTCSRCGRAAYSEWRPSSGEMHTFCSWCGYEEHLDVKVNHSKEGYKLVKRVVAAYGVCYAVYKSGKTKSFVFKKPLLLLKKIYLLTLLRMPSIDAKDSYMTVWDNNQNRIVVLFGKEQPEYTETERDFY